MKNLRPRDSVLSCLPSPRPWETVDNFQKRSFHNYLFSQWLSIPFAFAHPAVGNIFVPVNGSVPWLGAWDSEYAGTWFDSALLLVRGNLDLCVYLRCQRYINEGSKPEKNAQLEQTVSLHIQTETN